ncbi:hypothetical protein C8J56DRAFT_1050780 [Mycena floridula]|nr:hypothetical protein C8J56DRAFT_1050780 [Mycena floridula]
MAPWVRETSFIAGIRERSTSDELDFISQFLNLVGYVRALFQTYVTTDNADLTRPLDELIGFEMPRGFQYNELLNIVATTVFNYDDPERFHQEVNGSHWTTCPGPTDDPAIILRKATDNVSRLPTRPSSRDVDASQPEECIHPSPAPRREGYKLSRSPRLLVRHRSTDNTYRLLTLDQFTKLCGYSTDSSTKPPIIRSALPPMIAQLVSMIYELNYDDKVHHRTTDKIDAQGSTVQFLILVDYVQALFQTYVTTDNADLTRPLDELIGFEMPRGFQYNELLNIVATTVFNYVVELIGSKKPQGSQYNELLNIFAKPTYPPIMQDEMNSSHWTTCPGLTDDPAIILRKATDNVSRLLTHAGCRGVDAS